jgi:hypothetical protein
MPFLLDLGFAEEITPEKEEIREQVNLFDLVTYLGLEWNTGRDKVKCPFHSGGRERTPSMQVHDRSVWCFGGCNRQWDAFQLVMDLMHISFPDAKRWLVDNIAMFPTTGIKEAKRQNPYKGPVPIEKVMYWKSLLTESRRHYLREERMLTDETINAAGIGWRPELRAYVYPFWRGKPLFSEVDMVQFRSTPDSPTIRGDAWHYTGLTGHNRPSLVNRHRVGHTTIIVFGTADSYLGCQDGFCMPSINGISVMLRDEEAIARLKEVVAKVEIGYVVPDNQPNEVEPAYALARLLGSKWQVRHFPHDAPKDYTLYRKSGKSSWDFMREVLMTPWQSPFIENESDMETVTAILKYMCDGDWERTFSCMVALEQKYLLPILKHALMVKAGFDPFPGLDADQWIQFREEISPVLTYRHLAQIIKRWTDEAYAASGGF